MALEPYVNVSSTNAAYLFLLTFTDRDGKKIRVVNDLKDWVSRGQRFTAYPFSLNLQQQDGDRQPEITINLDNVDRLLIETLRRQVSPILMKLELIVSDAPNTVEKTIDFLKLVSVDYDAMTVTATLMPDDMLSQKFPYDTYSHSEFPDLAWQ